MKRKKGKEKRKKHFKAISSLNENTKVQVNRFNAQFIRQCQNGELNKTFLMKFHFL